MTAPAAKITNHSIIFFRRGKETVRKETPTNEMSETIKMLKKIGISMCVRLAVDNFMNNITTLAYPTYECKFFAFMILLR